MARKKAATLPPPPTPERAEAYLRAGDHADFLLDLRRVAVRGNGIRRQSLARLCEQRSLLQASPRARGARLGVNDEVMRIDEAHERRQIERLRSLRAKREAKRWSAALESVQEAARAGENLMPRILAAVESYATVGEISDAMRKVFGEYRETVVI